MRKLTQHEINSLLDNGCEAQDWTQILVSEQFTTQHVKNVHFSGRVLLGKFDRIFELAGGVCQHAGLCNVRLHNCEIGDNVCIDNVANYIANYRIASDCFIQNVNLLVVDKKTTFANGVRVNVLNETGGREVPIYDHLSSSLAYILALYRYKRPAIAELTAQIDAYAAQQADTMGTIAEHCTIMNAGEIRNVKVGPYTHISGCSQLTEGTINSAKHSPTCVGADVIASQFIISSGAEVSNKAQLIRCFVGQSCKISQSFMSHDSLMFANGVFENGEACAIFAGPFTVTSHKSTLLIGGMYSFFNAGSGSNQSNHMYKLGPIHQGIVERGSKTSSDSYLLWPARVGIFSLIMGRHYHHPDTTDMPFSYLMEQDGDTYLVPAANIRSVGTIRDAQKWPQRDKRSTEARLDYINYKLLSPYSLAKILKAKEILHALQQTSNATTETYTYSNTKIKKTALCKGIKLYDLAIVKYLGSVLVSRIAQLENCLSMSQLRQGLCKNSIVGEGEWHDLSGLLVPQSELHAFMTHVANGSLTLLQVNDFFAQMYLDFQDMEWTWAYPLIEQYFDVNLTSITAEALADVVNKWLNAVTTLDGMLLDDAMKEFSETSRLGFGVDGNEDDKLADFESVRGRFETDSFVKMVKEHIAAKHLQAETMLAMLSAIKTDD